MFKKYFWFLLFVLLMQQACAETPNTNIREISRAYADGESVLVVVFDEKTAAKNSEAYADWSAYLNDFIPEAKTKFKVIKLLPAELTLLIDNASGLKAPYTTLFLNKQHGNFYYPGPVLEPGVYLYVDTLYQQKEISEELALYKPEKLTTPLKLPVK